MRRKSSNVENSEETVTQDEKTVTPNQKVILKTNDGRKIVYHRNRTQSVTLEGETQDDENNKKETKNKTKDKKVKDKEKDKVEEFVDTFPHINANLNEGLNDDEVIERIKQGYINDDHNSGSKTVLAIVLGKIFTVFNLLCFAIAAIIIILAIRNHESPFSDLMFLYIMLANIAIGITTEVKSKKLIDKLTFDTAPTTKVIRNSIELTIESKDLVTDDICTISAGQRVPADAKVRQGKIEVNESLITGESVSIPKGVGANLYGGSYVVSGSCKIQLTNVGDKSYIQRLAKEAKSFKAVQSEIMINLNVYIRIVGILILPLIFILFGQLTSWFNDFAIFNDQNKVLGVLTAIIGMVPTGLILLTSVALTTSVFKLGKQNVLVHELYCIENLARVDTLCLDKTGTITDGTMSVIGQVMLTEEEVNLKTLISNILYVTKDENETARALEAKYGKSKRCKSFGVLPFSSQRKYSAASLSENETYLIGAPEFISRDLYKEHFRKINNEARKGNRVLLLAKSDEAIKNGKVGGNISAVALIVIQDNIRPGTQKTLSFFRKNQVKILVISGDNPLTVSAIANKAGVYGANKYINMSEVKDKDIPEIVDNYVVFGRVTPKQKQLLVKALKEKGHTVAMTGDGVNDILALKEADCSIAMASGSEAARNASQIVLTDSNFQSMPQVVAEGRKVINNIQKVATLFITKNVFSFFIVCFIIGLNIKLSNANPESFPMRPSQLSLIDILTIGLPGAILTIMPNNKPIQGRFMYNVLKNAIPGALVVLVNAAVIYLAAYTKGQYIHIDDIPTIITISTAITCCLVLLRVFFPMNFFKVLLFVAIATVMAILIFSDLKAPVDQTRFNFTSLNFPECLLIIVLAEASYPLIWLFSLSFTKSLRKFIQDNVNEWKNRDNEDVEIEQIDLEENLEN